MNEHNRNWGNQSNQDWDQNNNRSWQDENRNRQNRGSYGNAGYGQDYNQNQGMNSMYGNNRFDNSGRQQQMGRQNTVGGYGSQYAEGMDYNQNNMGSAGLYGGDFGRESWESDFANRGYRSGRGFMGTGSGYDYGSAFGSGRSGENYGAAGYRGNAGYGGRQQSSGSYQQRSGGDSDRDWWDRTRDEVSSWFGDDDAERRRRMDEQRTGMHRGKGPKDYKRSEDRIREDVCDRLSDDDRLDATNIEVQMQGDEVILTGTVNDRQQKRRAEDLVESISGVRNVENRIRVSNANDTTSNYNTGTKGYSNGAMGLT